MEGNIIRERKKPNKIEEMTKEQIRQAIIKKCECNAKAQNIVESLLEKSVTESYFLQCLPEINQCHFDDVIEERFIIHLCGYPLCSKAVFEKDIPKQQYRISMKTNKVYDITVRKNFCSNSCYKSAMYIKKQMLTSPLWFREYEIIPAFHLLPLDSVGSLGQEVDLGKKDRVTLKPEEPLFTSINDFTNASLHELGSPLIKQSNRNNNTDCDINHQKSSKVDKQEVSAIDQDINEKSKRETDTKQDENILNNSPNNELTKIDVELKRNCDNKIQIKRKSNPLNIIGEVIEKPEKKIDPILIDMPEQIKEKQNCLSVKKSLQRKQPSVITITIEVEKCLAEWFTIDTLIFLFGNERVKEMVADKGDCIQEYMSSYEKSIFYNSNTYDQYQALCRKLNMLELEDKKYDAKTLQREMKPLPDYSVIQEESKKMQLKVKAFFSGESEIPIAEPDSQIKEPEDTANTTHLPLVDKNAQNALRRRIVCQHLNKVLPDLLRSLNVSTLTISSDVRLLVNTFKLKANNIMLKPIQWTLIAIVFIKLLSVKDERLNLLLEQPTAFQHMQLLLLSYKQDGGYLDRLISWLTDIDRLLDVNDTKFTIE